MHLTTPFHHVTLQISNSCITWLT